MFILSRWSSFLFILFGQQLRRDMADWLAYNIAIPPHMCKLMFSIEFSHFINSQNEKVTMWGVCFSSLVVKVSTCTLFKWLGVNTSLFLGSFSATFLAHMLNCLCIRFCYLHFVFPSSSGENYSVAAAATARTQNQRTERIVQLILCLRRVYPHIFSYSNLSFCGTL